MSTQKTINTPLIFFWSLIVALGGFLFGFDTAVISGAEKHIQELFLLSSFEHGFAMASALIGTIIGALFSGYPSDKYGRKPMLFLISVLYIFSAIGSAVANNITVFIIFRLVGGIGVGASSVIAPMYISEISPATIRGKMTAMFQFNVIFGILMAYVSNYFIQSIGEDAWRWMLGIACVPSVLFFFLLFLIPESPRFLIKRGAVAKAINIFERIGIPDSKIEVQRIASSLDQSNLNSDNLFTRKYKKPILIAFLVAMFNQFSGINAILYYAPRIFELSGLSMADSLYQSIMIGVINAVSTLIGLALIDKVGRKTLLIVGSIGMAICLGLVSKTFYTENFEGMTLLVYLLTYILFFGFSTGAVIWVLIAEVFPTNVRGKGQSLGSLTHWLFAAIITFVFPIIIKEIKFGAGHTFLFFSVMMILQVIVTWYYFPETKKRTLEELSQNL